eukprot:TRINITY_DN4927_c0_g2_i1.p1 TRINITY_DN4927_c0_g2~~TRINITY_DN4927_c0_g2_i1.p1  ORF type:complete len:193 (-),score=50.96 TRINITY_DN4927_c0_g2_i1:76-654(-)
MKVVVVGDTGVGKTSFLMGLTKLDGLKEGEVQSPQTDQVPTMLKGTLTLHHNGKDIIFHDTSAHKDHIRIRQSTYETSSVVLCLFSVDSNPSFSSTRNNWEAEIQHYAKGTPWLLIGNKTDLRESTEDCIATPAGQQRAKELNVPYLECSAWNGEGLEEIVAKISTYDQVEVEEEPDFLSTGKPKSTRCDIL